MSDARTKRFYKNRILKDGNGFAENGMFASATNPTDKRAIRVSVERTSNKNSDDGTNRRIDTIIVWLFRDPDDPDVGGVRNLQPNDRYWRDPDVGDDSQPYQFNGTIIEEGKWYTVAEFERHQQNSVGFGV